MTTHRLAVLTVGTVLAAGAIDVVSAPRPVRVQVTVEMTATTADDALRVALIDERTSSEHYLPTMITERVGERRRLTAWATLHDARRLRYRLDQRGAPVIHSARLEVIR